MWITKKVKSNTGKHREDRVTGYRLNLDDLMADFVHRKVMGADVETMKDLIAVIKQTLSDAETLKKTAVEKDFKLMRKAGKRITELNK